MATITPAGLTPPKNPDGSPVTSDTNPVVSTSETDPTDSAGGDGGDEAGDVSSSQPGGDPTVPSSGGGSSALGSENFLAPGGSGTGGDLGSTPSAGGGGSLTTDQQDAVDKLLSDVNSGDSEATKHSTAALLNITGTDEFSGMSVQMIIQKALMDAYDGAQKDLKDIAHRYKFFNQVKTNLRNEITKVQAALAGASDGPLNPPFSWTPATKDLNPGPNGNVDTTKAASANPFQPIDGSSYDPTTGGSGVGTDGTITDKNTLNAYAKKLDGDLDTAGDNSSELQTKLQAITSAQQQLLSVITQLIKNWNDTSMSIIHNI